jgi:hypothetical protein
VKSITKANMKMRAYAIAIVRYASETAKAEGQLGYARRVDH